MTCGAQQLKAKLQNEPNGWLARPLSSSTWKHWYLCMHQTTQASGVYCNENTLANTNMYFVSIRSVQATQLMFHLSVEGIQWQKVHSQWDCVSLNIANSECAQTLKLLVASDSFRSFFFFLKCKIWNTPQMLHNNPHMHGVRGLGLVDLRSLRWTPALIDIKIYVFADSHLLSRHSNLNRSCTNDCHQRKFVLCQWYCFWLEPIRHTLHSTPPGR